MGAVLITLLLALPPMPDGTPLVSARALGRRRPLLGDWSVDLPPGAGSAGSTPARQAIGDLMPLAWNEITGRALRLAVKWSEASSERSDSQTFWNEFFDTFGRDRSRLAVSEQPVKNLDGHTDFVDVFWEGRMTGETKSRGKDLDKAYDQALGYVHSLAREHGDARSARHVVLTDFEWIELFDLKPPADTKPDDLDPGTGVLKHRFRLRDLPEHAHRFAFLSGHQTRALDPEDPANLEAAQLLANLHDRLEDGGYAGHDLQVFMVRVLFCLFAEDTDAIPRDSLKTFLRNNTREDGSDLEQQLALPAVTHARPG